MKLKNRKVLFLPLMAAAALIVPSVAPATAAPGSPVAPVTGSGQSVPR